MSAHMKRLSLMLIGAALIAMVPGVYAATAGRVQFASGDVQIVAGGINRAPS